MFPARESLTFATLLLFVASSFLVSTTANAATYYVSGVGSDSNSGSQAQPFREIRRAITVAAPGDNILVADGSYLGFDIINKSGTGAAPITIRALGSGARVTPTTDRPENRDNIVLSFSNYWILDGLRSSNAGRAAVFLDNAHNVTVRNGVYADNYRWGIFTNRSNDSLFEGNECYGSITQHGIYVSNSCARPTVRRNLLHHNSGCGLHMNGDLNYGPNGLITEALVERNIIWANGASGGAGINMDGPQDSVIRNNLIYGNSAGGITAYRIDAAEGPKNVQILNNTIDMPSNGRWAVLIKQSAGLITLRNNILLHANSARGGVLYGDATDVSNTDSDFNILDRATPNDGATVYSLSQWKGLGHESHSFSASRSTLFVDPAAADFHLRGGAAAIDAGTPVAVPSDFEGNSRPTGGGYDIGCDEIAGPPPPVISSLSPSSATAGGPGFTLIVTGTGFVNGAAVKWNGSTRATTVASSTEVRATIPAADIAAAGTVQITAANAGSADSNALPFSISAPPVYSLTASPTSVTPGQGIAVTFTAPVGSSAKDWVGFYRVGADDRTFLAYRYTGGLSSGTLNFTAPNAAGEYEFRYFVNNSYDRRAVSNRVSVGGSYTLTASPTSAAPGGNLSVNWTAPAGSSQKDWIGLFRVGAGDRDYVAWRFTGGAASGRADFVAPATPGDYEFRYYLNGGYVMAVASNRVTVSAISSYSLTAIPVIASPGGPISVSWTAGADRTTTDWIGLYKVGADDRAIAWWKYTAGAATGKFDLSAPLAVGDYEFRYFKQNGYVRLATSNRITVTSAAYALAAHPSTVARGGSITVTWLAPAGSKPKDWIGMYRVGTADTQFVAYKYTGGLTSGTAVFTAPSTVGQYEFRYFVDNGYVRRATSNIVTVN